MSTNSNTLKNATEFAEIAYAGHKRKSGEDLRDHCVRVKKNLQSIRIKDENILSAAVLHATVSVANVKLQEVEDNFGKDIAYMVDVLTNISKIAIPIKDSPERVTHLHKLIIHLAKDMRILLIRLADRLDNIRTADALPKEDQNWVATKALHIYAPIAKAVGTYSFARELENEALKIINPERYNKIKKYLDSQFKKSERDLILIKNELSKEVEKYDEKFEISFRKKGIYSTHKKATRKAEAGEIINEEAFNELYDLLGLRVLVESVDTCYKVLAHIQKNFEIIQEEYDDYIANPKPNGYRSLQVAIKIKERHTCEIQIRTFEMHDFNEYGPASHFSYKYGEQDKKDDASWIKHLVKLKGSIQKEIGGNSEIKLFDDTIFVFTPNNDVITLPKDSTPVDFAYAVHTAIGDECCRAFVNDKLVSLDTKLESGQTIKILTKKGHKPSSDWLRFVKTSEARRHISKANHPS